MVDGLAGRQWPKGIAARNECDRQTHGATMTDAELSFTKKMDAAGKRWIFEPTRFRLPDPYRSYRPDFYIVDDDIFIEVVGTRQAFCSNRKTYESFRETYPHIKFKVVNLGAWKRGEGKKRIEIPHSNKFNRREHKPIAEGDVLPLPLKKLSMADPNEVALEVIDLVRSGRFKNIRDVAMGLNITKDVLGRAIHSRDTSSLHFLGVLHILRTANDAPRTALQPV